MSTHIATVFDKNYIVRTLAFYESLQKLGKDYKFWFLCLDNETKEIMARLDLPGVILSTLEDLADNELLATKKDRSIGEFAFTAKSVFINYIANKITDGEALIFADNDVIFFLPPDELLEKMRAKNYSIGITAHRFSKGTEYMNEKVGKYNAGLLFFIIDQNSRACIKDWRDDCIDWCYLLYEEERYGDQKYIVKWPKRYEGVYEIPDKGINTGSWNLSNWKVTEKENQFFIDEDPLVCYHFHRIKFYIDGENLKPLPIHIYHDRLYQIYTKLLENAWVKICTLNKDWKYGFVEKPNILRLWKQKLTKLICTKT